MAAYPAGFCRAVMKCVVESGPWLGNYDDDVGNVVATDHEIMDMLVGTGQDGTNGKSRRAAV